MSRIANRSARSKPYDRPQNRHSGQWLHDMSQDADVPASVVDSGLKGGMPSSKLIVSNLHYNIMPKDLIAIFGQIGTLVREPIIKVRIAALMASEHYDRSGRSTGVAIIHYENHVEATRAKKQFNGILAKDQPMSIAFDASRPPAKRVVSSPASLMNRISKPPLLERLGSDAAIPTAPRKAIQMAASVHTGTGPVRARGGRRRGGRSEKPKKEAKTAEDLDKELDAFMEDDAAKDSIEADVEMET
ncbi:hypothetical protein EW145_g652 [Phellinidium pouzarii]|uniref:RRM domain-containing protein n=1 Tax=Phellinidium pouzarii TaxID=167371 RepID=A0A4S4LHF2_9AGAM|nr:hypothetical protein EW145_g652 [Phellinidium pouzarii]